jgi:uncharacterized protein YrrD
MLLLGSRMMNTPVMSLQTGTQLAHITKPLIDPATLKIVAYEVDGPLLVERPSYLRVIDVRELSGIGMIIDSSDEFINADDVIKVKQLIDLGFEIIGMSVIDELKHKIGKVDDFTVDTDSFLIQQINVKRGLIRSLTDTGLLIHRTQIVEINDKNIIVKTTAKKVETVVQPERSSYINPFRTPTPQVESSDSN